ncbi:dipeptide/oligopeptide/nickel ABC transporter ATP-binding protein [Bordetella genomosp. 8]|uniref:Dipeptide/oligopeptide/nickel ABC transporter ATP-binding protein n=1 Tax=Bordetella genomosp. 8 TaxID=1416806 RepID=A0A1W6YL70_9BORD|nr:ABC transporter ATP-binding protein [Bordetella genomosp. 8]ARP81719.1 dipeptide/oligopeptide/nickel ABC transporter ATP-binding protein [Bordetella genomosp. 8]
MNNSPHETDAPVLSVSRLTTEFRIKGQWHPAIRDLSLHVGRNETLAIVGESGCGKSITALSVMRLINPAQGRIAGGQIRLDGQDLLALSEPQMEKVRGNAMAMIFQEPMTSLNPVMTIGSQIAESVRFHRRATREQARARALELLEWVRIPAAARRYDDYPHQFSGGMRQRVMIAMALACEPRLLLADEPTTALDVTIQVQILALLAELKATRDMGMVFITHNLGVVASIADRVAVMYGGRVIEQTDVQSLFDRPTHPYTEALLRSMPRVDRPRADLQPIPGQVPPITVETPGCRYADRCPLVQPRCRQAVPPLAPVGGNLHHLARCWVRADAVDADVNTEASA